MKSRIHRAESVLFMADLQKLADIETEDGILSEDEEEDSEGDLSKQNLEDMFSHEEDEDVEHEMPLESPPNQGEEDRSVIPKWFYELSKEEQTKIETFFSGNLEKGALTAEASLQIMEQWNLSDDQMDELC